MLQSVGEEHGKGPQPSKVGKILNLFCSLSLFICPSLAVPNKSLELRQEENPHMKILECAQAHLGLV